MLDDGGTVIFEGAQGALLDIDHGTYPFVTSSNPVAGAACIGAGVGPRDVNEVWGVAKAYATRVGAGPFPTELDGELARVSCASAAASSARRPAARAAIGWLDLVALRYAARINGLTALVVTKLDVLAGVDRISVCTRYRGGEDAEFDHFPYHQSVLHRVRGDYVELEGFEGDVGEARSEEDLPDAAREYLRFIAEQVGVPVTLVGRRSRPRPGDLDAGRAVDLRAWPSASLSSRR